MKAIQLADYVSYSDVTTNITLSFCGLENSHIRIVYMIKNIAYIKISKQSH